MFYSIISYFILGLLLTIYYMRVEDTNTGPFSGSAETRSYKDTKAGFNKEWTPLFIFTWLLAPLTLPIVLMIWLIHYVGTKVYDRWFKPIS